MRSRAFIIFMLKNSSYAAIILMISSCLPDREFPAPVLPPAKGSGTVVINEIAPNESPDWVEMANPGDQDLQMKAREWFFSDDTTNRTKDTLKVDLVIPAKAYRLIECNPVNPLADRIKVAFSLSSTNGEFFGIYRKKIDGSLEIVSEVQFPAGIAAGTSFAQKPDLKGSFQISSTPSPGQPNL